MVDAYDLIIVATVLIGTIENSSKPLKFPMPWPFGAKVISVTMGRLVDQVPFDFHWGGEHLDRLPLDKPIGGQVDWRSTLQLFVNVIAYLLVLHV